MDQNRTVGPGPVAGSTAPLLVLQTGPFGGSVLFIVCFRVLKMGTLGWYHDNVRNRFKRFGSAKVMRSLYKRLNGDGESHSDVSGPWSGCSDPACVSGSGGRDDDTQSMPDVGSRKSLNKPVQFFRTSCRSRCPACDSLWHSPSKPAALF